MVNSVNGINGDHVPNGIGDEEGGRMDEEPVKPEKPVHRQIRVTYEEYKTIANLLILHLRQLEEVSQGTCVCVCAIDSMLFMYEHV